MSQLFHTKGKQNNYLIEIFVCNIVVALFIISK